MANHKSAIKRTRSDYTKKQHNKYLHKTTRNAIKKLKTGQVTVNSDEISKVFSLIDKLIKNNIIHKNKGANLKSKISKLEVKNTDKNNSKSRLGEKKNTKKKIEKKSEAIEEVEVKSSAKEEPAKEVPAQEVPAEEVPAEEVPAEEVPAEEVPTEDKDLKSTDSLEKE